MIHYDIGKEQMVLKNIHTYIGSDQWVKIPRKSRITYQTDNKTENQRNFCLEHQQIDMKFSRETSVLSTKFEYTLPLQFLGAVDFETMDTGENTMKQKTFMKKFP